MSQLFIQAATEAWSVLALSHAAYRLSASSSGADSAEVRTSVTPLPFAPPMGRAERGDGLAPVADVENEKRNGPLLIRLTPEETDSAHLGGLRSDMDWAVLPDFESPLRLNGTAVKTGIAVLRNQDELCIPGAAPVFFSTERLVTVAPYGGSDSPACPRCTYPIERGEASVCCPGCSVFHHQLSDRKCWGYTHRCALCDQSTSLAAGYRWSPENL